MTLVFPVHNQACSAVPKVRNKDSRTEPPPIWLHPSWLRLIFALLERRSLNNLAIGVPDWLSAVKHLESAGLLRIAIEIFSFDPLESDFGSST